MKIELLKDTVLDGERVVRGEVVETKDVYLVNTKAAVKVSDNTPVGKPSSPPVAVIDKEEAPEETATEGKKKKTSSVPKSNTR